MLAATLVILILSPVVVLATHVLLSRVFVLLWRDHPHQAVCMLGVFAGAVPTGLLLWRFAFKGLGPGAPLLPAVIYSAVVYLMLAYSYFHLFNMSETARRIRILYELSRTGGMEVPELESRYDPLDLVAVRMERLVSMGQVAVKDGRYVIRGGLLLHAARLLALWGRVLGMG